MDLNIYQIIQGPIISDKAYKLNQNKNQLVLKVHPAANKPMIKDALNKLFNVKVKSIHTVTRKGKSKIVKRKKVTGPTTKKAIITLAEGYSLDLLNQVDTKASQERAKGPKSNYKK